MKKIVSFNTLGNNLRNRHLDYILLQLNTMCSLIPPFILFNTMKKIYLPLYLCLLFSCNNKSQIIEQKSNKVKDKEVLIQTNGNIESKYISYKSIKDLPMNEAIHKYKPLFMEKFLLCDGDTEFRANLYKVFSKEKWNTPIKITEITWETTNEKNLTVWYQLKKEKWVLIEHFIWDKDSEF